MKIIRTITYFADAPYSILLRRCRGIKAALESMGYQVQTLRVVVRQASLRELQRDWSGEKDFFWSVGGLSLEQAERAADDFMAWDMPLFFHVECPEQPASRHVDLWWRLAKERAERTFRFSYVFANAADSPFFPAAAGKKRGFALGLQTPDLAEGCELPSDWLARMSDCWKELHERFASEPDFLGIDASIAPMGAGAGSLVGHVERWYGSWDAAVLSNFFVRISRYIKNQNPCPVGINGWFFPCLEDAGLARLYEQGGFSTERNLFLSMHCASGIDTYPVAMDESPERMLHILQLTHALAYRYEKPLSVRWVCDGKNGLGQRTELNNKYLQEVVLRPL